MTILRIQDGIAYYRAMLFVASTWLLLVVTSQFAFNDPTAVFMFPLFPIGAVFPMVRFLWDGRTAPVISAMWKIASASTLASVAGYAWVTHQKAALSVLLLLTVVAIGMTGLLTLSSLHLSNDYVTFLPPAITWGLVLLLSAIVLILSHICRQRGAIGVRMEVAAFVWTLSLLNGAWYCRNPLVKYVGEFHEGLAHAEASGRWGYVDRQGRFVIRPKFHDAKGFSEGLAEVFADCALSWFRQSGLAPFDHLIWPHPCNRVYGFGYYLRTCSVFTASLKPR
ncbi:MAG: WG repeat-containing protein, partial [Acidobacteriota bacterium]